jgi:hypothetical protein
VCLPVLRAECTLTVVTGASIPAEAEEYLVLERNGSAIRVRTPADLSGCVLIESGKEALEYLRFFSSLWTAHLFEQPSLEILAARKKKGACIKTCLPVKIWNRLGFEKPDVSETSDGFVVSRFVIRRAHSELGISVFRVVEKVGHDGAVTVLTERALELAREDTAGLGFADYL